MTELNLNEIKSDLDAVPPPPWRWIGRKETGPLLVTDHSGQLYLLGPAHPVDEHGWPLTDDEDVPIYADLMFRDERDSEDRYPVMRRAAEMIVPRTSYDPATYRDIDNPVARWIVRSAEHATALLAEVVKLREQVTAVTVAASERQDAFELGRAQMERDHAETVAEVGRIRELHSEFRIYDECGHESEDHNGDPFEVDNVGWTCQDGYLYSICRECCTDGSSQTEECASGHRHNGSSICNTRAALNGGEQP